MRLSRTTWFLIVFGELMAVGTKVWLLYEHRGRPWWVLTADAFGLVAILFAATIAFYCLRRARKLGRC